HAGRAGITPPHARADRFRETNRIGGWSLNSQTSSCGGAPISGLPEIGTSSSQVGYSHLAKRRLEVLILRSSARCLARRASRRMAAGSISLVAVLRDARKRAP